MMPPIPALVAFAVLFGYPLIQIAAILLRRRKRLRFNATVTELLSDPSMGFHDRLKIRRSAERSRGKQALPILLTLPYLVFKATLKEAVKPKQNLNTNERFKKIDALFDEATDLEWATWPITFGLLLPVSIASWAIAAVIVWAKGTARPHFPNIHDLARISIAAAP